MIPASVTAKAKGTDSPVLSSNTGNQGPGCPQIRHFLLGLSMIRILGYLHSWKPPYGHMVVKLANHLGFCSYFMICFCPSWSFRRTGRPLIDQSATLTSVTSVEYFMLKWRCVCVCVYQRTKIVASLTCVGLKFGLGFQCWSNFHQFSYQSLEKTPKAATTPLRPVMSRSWQGPLSVEPCQPAPNISAESGRLGGDQKFRSQSFKSREAVQNL